MERLSVGKLRVKAKLHQPDYVPKKEFGFRTINSPNKFKEINAESINTSKQSSLSPNLHHQQTDPNEPEQDQHAGTIEIMESIVLPDSFTASQKVHPLINQVQHESPSGKFQTRLLEREKERQMAQMEARVRKLEIDRQRAQKQLKKTLDAHDAAEQANKRKQDHLEAKKEWLRT